jgi:hypothetical protein
VKSSLFSLVGIQQPGRVNLYHFGTVNLAELDDDTLLRIYRSGNTKYLHPSAEGIKILFPEINIVVQPNPVLPPGDTPKKNKRKRTT